MRGLIVRNVATKRAQQSHSQAEAITHAITEKELCERIDAELDSRVVAMNVQLGKKLSIVNSFVSAGNQMRVRSSRDGVEVGFMNGTRSFPTVSGSDSGNSIELWLRSRRYNGVESTKMGMLIAQSPNWLATYLTNSPSLSAYHTQTLDLETHAGWLVLRLHE